MKVVILAGGKGTRLKPYTTVFPKPLMPINEKPILEILIQQLESHGLVEIIMAVGHLSELVKSFFNDGQKYKVKIKYSKEEKPLGTIGPIGNIKSELKKTFFVINGDTLTDLNYSSLLQHHKKSKCIATVAVTKREIEIDYGIPHLTNDEFIEKYDEKPTINYHVGTGICVFEPEILNYIKTGEYLDLPNLLKKLFNTGEKVNAYIHPGYWFDIGRPPDYEEACNFIENMNNLV